MSWTRIEGEGSGATMNLTAWAWARSLVAEMRAVEQEPIRGWGR